MAVSTAAVLAAVASAAVALAAASGRGWRRWLPRRRLSAAVGAAAVGAVAGAADYGWRRPGLIGVGWVSASPALMPATAYGYGYDPYYAGYGYDDGYGYGGGRVWLWRRCYIVRQQVWAAMARPSGRFRSATEPDARRLRCPGAIACRGRGLVIGALWYGDCIIRDDADWPHRSGFDMAVSGRGGFACCPRRSGPSGRSSNGSGIAKAIVSDSRRVSRYPARDVPPRAAISNASCDQPSTLYFLNQACI